MTTITQDINDIAGVDDNTSWTFCTKTIRLSDSGDAIVTTKRVRKYPVAGVLTVELDPGPAVVLAPDGKSYPFTVPETDSDLWPLIQAAVTIPPSTTHQQLVDAVDAWLDIHTLIWGDITGTPAPLIAGGNNAGGYPILDGGGKVAAAQLPSSIMDYKGVWNAATNSPTLIDGTGSAGDVYRVGTGASRNLGSGAIVFDVGDYAIYNGTTWEKSDTTDAVASVAGLTGVISASGLRTALSLVIGADVQAFDADLAAFAALVDPNADRLLFWDDSAGAWTHLTLGTNLSITGTTINAAGGGGSGDVVGPSSSVDAEVVLFNSTTGKLVKRATITGLAKLIAGVLSAAVAGTDYYAPGSTDVAIIDGGTGASTASAARTNLGLVIGTDVQAFNAALSTLAGLTATTDNFIVAVASAWASRTPAQVRTTLGLVIGTNVQAWDADLDTLAGLTATTNNFIVAVAGAWASRTPAQVKTTLAIAQADISDINQITPNRQTASYSIVLSDVGKAVEMNVAGANNLTVPLNSAQAIPVNSVIGIGQYGAGQTTVVATGGVTIRSRGGALKLTGQYAEGSLRKIGSDEWWLSGDITV